MTCDRACLSDVVDQYLAALAARDPSRVPAAPGLRYTENCQELGLWSGLWATATGLGPYRLDVADPEAGQVGVLATVEEMGNPAALALRLAVRDRRVAEAEALVARFGNPIFSPESLLRPRPELTRAVPQRARCPRRGRSDQPGDAARPVGGPVPCGLTGERDPTGRRGARAAIDRTSALAQPSRLSSAPGLGGGATFAPPPRPAGPPGRSTSSAA